MPAVLILGALYFLAGIVFGGLAGQAGSHQMRIAWRWAAWVASALAFGAHKSGFKPDQKREFGGARYG